MREQCNARRLIQSNSNLPKTYHTRLQELRKSYENQSTGSARGCCDEIVKKNNTRYTVQGAVESSCHINNIRYETVTQVSSVDKAIQQNKRINLQEETCKKCGNCKLCT
jgi:hypothetical protein|tara:strand:+ start:115 stop:441 length:327 start_codon:yes stop_codon:yes gene_type:complete